MRFSCVVSVTYLAFVQFGLSFGYDSFITDCKYLLIFNSYMAYPIIEIVAWCKDIVFDGFNRFRCHIGSSEFTGGLAFPVFMHFTKFLFGFFCDIKRICCPGFNGIQFILQPLEGIFRESLTASRCDGTAAYDQFLITNDDGDMTQNVSKSLGTSGDDRFTFCSLIRLCDQLCSGRFDHRHMSIQILHKSGNPG